MKKNVKPEIKNVLPRVCATCDLCNYDKYDGAVFCETQDRIIADVGDMQQWYQACSDWGNSQRKTGFN